MIENNSESLLLDFNKIVELNLNIVLTTDEDDERSVFISGNFNNRQTKDTNYKMGRVGVGLYHFVSPSNFNYPENLLYKFIRGD